MSRSCENVAVTLPSSTPVRMSSGTSSRRSSSCASSDVAVTETCSGEPVTCKTPASSVCGVFVSSCSRARASPSSSCCRSVRAAFGWLNVQRMCLLPRCRAVADNQNLKPESDADVCAELEVLEAVEPTPLLDGCSAFGSEIQPRRGRSTLVSGSSYMQRLSVASEKDTCVKRNFCRLRACLRCCELAGNARNGRDETGWVSSGKPSQERFEL